MTDVAQHLPSARRVVFLADDPAGLFDPSVEPFEILLPPAFAPSDHRPFAFALSSTAYCCFLKSHAVKYLRRTHHQQALIYLDSDTRLYSPPTELLAAIEDHPVVLTPHLLEASRNQPAASSTVQYGTYNAGVIGLGADVEADRFLTWWSAQFTDPHRAGTDFLYDQVWLNLVPSLFPGTLVLRHPGYNVAYWNLHERDLSPVSAASEWSVNGQPLVIFHFSGFRREDAANLAGKSRPHFPAPDPRWAKLGISYAERLREFGADVCEQWEYGFARFRDGKCVTPEHRAHYSQRYWTNRLPNADPFDPASGQFGRGLKSLYYVDHPVSRGVRRLKMTRLD